MTVAAATENAVPAAAPLLGPLTVFPQTSIAAHELLGPHRDALLRFVEGASRSKKFPGPSPWSLERRHFKTLRDGGYWVAPKTDGVRAALVCLEHAGTRVVAFMDRARRLWVLLGAEMHICTAWFQGSIIDGELCDGDFLIFDALAVSGVGVGHLTFSGRLDAVAPGTALHQGAQNDTPPVRIYMKAFDRGDAFQEARATAPGVDGIILMPEHHPYVVGRHKALWKLKTHHTVDFRVMDAQGTLGVLAAGTTVPAGRLDQECPFPPPGSIVECELVGPDLWRVTRLRDDKDHPNDKLTWTNTLKNVRENISYGEVLALFR